MAKLIDIDKSNFIEANIERYASDKISQYSRYLDQSHIFCTYYPINKVMSRIDKGLGNIYSDRGKNSSQRYNKIKNLPLFNVPELKPELEYDETGTDIEMSISGVTLLPNTVKPNAGDYLIIKIPGAKEYLFRVTNYEFNTIQSNDYYQISLEIKDIGTDLEKKAFDGLIIDTFETIYENIGTEDKCFIRSVDIPKLKALVDLIEEMKEMYKDNFFDKKLGCFCVKYYDDFNYFYDYLLNRFIMESEIYYEYNNPETIMLVNLDSTGNSERYYNFTLFKALINGTKDYLAKNLYYYTRPIYSLTSIFRIYDYPCHTIELVTLDYVSKNSGYKEYFSHELIESILNPEENPFDRIIKKEPFIPIEIKPLEYPTIIKEEERRLPVYEHSIEVIENTEEDTDNTGGSDSENEDIDEPTKDDSETGGEGSGEDLPETQEPEVVEPDETPNTESSGDESLIQTMMFYDEIPVIKNEDTETNEEIVEEEEEIEPSPLYLSHHDKDVEVQVDDTEEPIPYDIYNLGKDETEKVTPWEYKDVDYLELIVYNYLINQDQEIERKKIIPYLLKTDIHSYYFIPLIVFILKKKYDKYFVKEEL